MRPRQRVVGTTHVRTLAGRSALDRPDPKVDDPPDTLHHGASPHSDSRACSGPLVRPISMADFIRGGECYPHIAGN